MKFTAKQPVLERLAVDVVPVVPVNSPRAVLQCFQVSVAPHSLTFAGTDTDQAIVATTPLVDTEEAWSFLIPARKLAAVLKEAPNTDVTVSTEGATATVSAGSSEWALGLKTSLGEFPALPDAEAVKWEETERAPFLAALRAVRHAVSRDVRPALACVAIVRSADGTARFNAYDGARFQQAVLESFPQSMWVPAAGSPSAVDELVRLLSGSDAKVVEVASTDKKLLFRAGSVMFATGPHMARTADAEQELLVPALASAKQEFTVQRQSLIDAVRRVRVSADSETSAIGLRLNGTYARVLARDKSGNHAHEDVDGTWDGKEGRLVVLNHKYLTDALEAHPAPECKLRLSTSDSARKRSLVLLRDEAATVSAVLTQGHPKSLGLT